MKNRRTVLIVDRDPNFRRNASRFLKDRGFEVVDVAHPSHGLAILDAESPAFVILDLGMVDPAGIEVLATMVRSENRPHVVCVAADARVPDVVEAVRRGALDVFERPVDGERLVRLFDETTQRAEQGRPNAVVLERELEVDLLVTSSPAMQNVLQNVRDRCSEPILLVEGEPGAGQEWVARYAHSIGPRCEGPFVIVPEHPTTGSVEDHLFGGGDVPSAFASARGGLVYIEAICALRADGQERLWNLLKGLLGAKGGGAEVRWPPMIGGTDRDLKVEVAAGRLREDVASAFSQTSIRVPPLRQRREDIPELVRRIMQAVQRQVGATGVSVSPQVLEELNQRDWPGNLPELQRVVSEACVLGDGGLILLDLTAQELSPAQEEPVDKKPTKSGWRPTLDTSGDVQPYDIYEAEIFRFALENAGGCVSRAAELLGVGRATMYRKMRAYNIDVPPVSERAIARSRGARQRRQEERAAAEARRRAFHEQNAS